MIDITKLSCGWLSPTGEFLKCGLYDRIITAREICDTHYSGSGKRIEPDDFLLSIGWVNISMSVIHKKTWNLYWYKNLSPEQLSFIEQYFEDEIGVADFSQMMWEKAKEEA